MIEVTMLETQDGYENIIQIPENFRSYDRIRLTIKFVYHGDEEIEAFIEISELAAIRNLTSLIPGIAVSWHYDCGGISRYYLIMKSEKPVDFTFGLIKECKYK